jgi:hypothetical protein
VLLPARFNDGRDIPDVLLADAINEIVAEFEAASLYKEAAEGYWVHEEILYRDQLALIVVDVRDTAKNRKWMRGFKARWKEKLEQIEIWMVSYQIDIE